MDNFGPNISLTLEQPSSGSSNMAIREKTESICLLLELPVEVILLIADKLPTHSQAVLAHTCRALSVLFWQDGTKRSCDFDIFKYLYAIARDLPEMWVCDFCVKLHPELPYHDAPCFAYRSSEGQERFPLIDHILAHSDLELSLKMARINLELYRPRIKKLLKSRCHIFDTMTHTDDFEDMNATLRIRPKLVDGKFLIYKSWYFDGEFEDLPTITIIDTGPEDSPLDPRWKMTMGYYPTSSDVWSKPWEVRALYYKQKGKLPTSQGL